jgi:aminopeptidase N
VTAAKPEAESNSRVVLRNPLIKPESPQARDELAVALANPDSNVRLDAVSDLPEIDDQQASGILTSVASQDPDPLVRAAALHAIADRRAETSNPALMRALADSDPRVRKAAIVAMEGSQAEDSLPNLAMALQDSDASVRATAVEAIAEIGGEGARRLLESVLADESAVVREAASEHLSQER